MLQKFIEIFRNVYHELKFQISHGEIGSAISHGHTEAASS